MAHTPIQINSSMNSRIELDILAYTGQVSRLHLNQVSCHRTTHLIVFVTIFRVPSPAVNFGRNGIVIGSRIVQNATAPLKLVPSEVPS
jgi:hypothetical protein